jgi:Flp pilus assembly protein TadD
MNKVIFCWIFAFPLLLAPAVTLAGQPVDNYSANALTTAQYEAVVAKLEPVVKRDRNDESLLLNLAMAYRYTGRDAEATALYQRVLALDNAELDTANGGTMWSHAVARRALARPMQISAR